MKTDRPMHMETARKLVGKAVDIREAISRRARRETPPRVAKLPQQSRYIPRAERIASHESEMRTRTLRGNGRGRASLNGLERREAARKGWGNRISEERQPKICQRCDDKHHAKGLCARHYFQVYAGPTRKGAR